MIVLDNERVRVIRRDRKSLSFKILADGRLEVRMPLAMTMQELEDLMIKKQHVLDRLVLRHNERCTGMAYKEGTKILLLGELLEISFVENPGFAWSYEDKLYIDKYFEHGVPVILKNFYEEQSKVLIQMAMQAQRDLGFRSIKISRRWMTSRWGSYRSSGNMTLNIALVMAPPGVIDYVIIHELCHQRHPNHSPKFWQELKRFMPDFQNHRAWLKKNGHHLRVMPQIL